MKRHEGQEKEASAAAQGNTDARQIQRIAQMIGTDKISEALKTTEHFFAEVRKGQYSSETFQTSIHLLIDEILKIYRNVLQEKEKELLRFRNIYQFAQIEELMEELTGWMIGFHEKLDTEFDDYRNKSRMQQAIDYIQKNYAADLNVSLIYISEPTRQAEISYAVFCLKKKK